MILVEAVGREPRPCIDYRRLNSSIRNQYFPLPNIEERVERVSAAMFITVIDLAKGYWQIPLSKRAQRYAAFVTNFGTYVPLRMPFGLVNAPYFFSKLMSQVLENCESFAVPYLDDIAIYSNNWEDHLKHVDEVLKRIYDANLTIKPSKCKFAQNRTKYLGHVVGSGVRTPAEAKIKAILDFPTPTSKTQIRAFLGLAGYYAHYVKNFSVIAAPLTNVLKGKVKRENIIWTKECNQAFEELKRRLTQNPVLYAPDYKIEFIVQSDASDLGMGVVLSQRDAENEEHPVLYLSKKISDAERKYSATERECAAIIYAIKNLKYYLDGQIFTIETDHNPLVWLKSNAGSNPRLMRWSLELQPFQYKVIHKAGKNHSNADALSRSETRTKNTN
ncbi:Retrovirus-related Pol polyprotein from transposon 297 [Araneus ventricosus]|uniref:RNA-directed DNA polymerase n=1 Tax=Araneus ventricosus TaxID=182803 RepID=A0A4Y2K8J9_ARAVE|nr:Retrovirus-related Pol polyprotein from transposon 297 [Araneus ventricosus]